MKKIIKNTTISIAMACMCGVGSGSDYKIPLSAKTVSNLDTSLSEALNTNPDILMKKAEQDVSRHKVTQAVGAYLPSIDLSAGVGKEYVKQAYRKNSLASIDTRGSQTRTRYNPSITLNQKVFDGLETPYDIKKSHKELYQSIKTLEESQILVAFDVIDKYIAVRRFERLLRLAKENVRTHDSILSKIKQLIKGGKATSSDEENVQARLYDAQAAVGDIQGDLDAAYANFKEVVGAEANRLRVPTFNDALIPVNVQDAIAVSFEKNPSVIVARSSEEVAKADFDKTISPFLPSVNFQLQARKDYDVGGKSGLNTNVTGQLIGNFNVFKGGRDLGKRRELRAKMRSAKHNRYKAMRRAEKEVRVSYAELISARSQSKSLKGSVTSKKAVRDIYMKQFDAGTRSFIDILDASHEFFLAKGSLITADATEDLSAARLLASMGILLDQFKNNVQIFSENLNSQAPQLKIVSSKDKKEGSAQRKNS